MVESIEAVGMEESLGRRATSGGFEVTEAPGC